MFPRKLYKVGIKWCLWVSAFEGGPSKLNSHFPGQEIIATWHVSSRNRCNLLEKDIFIWENHGMSRRKRFSNSPVPTAQKMTAVVSQGWAFSVICLVVFLSHTTPNSMCLISISNLHTGVYILVIQWVLNHLQWSCAHTSDCGQYSSGLLASRLLPLNLFSVCKVYNIWINPSGSASQSYFPFSIIESTIFKHWIQMTTSNHPLLL